MAVVQQSTNGLLSSHCGGLSEALPGIAQKPASNNYAFSLHGRLVRLGHSFCPFLSLMAAPSECGSYYAPSQVL